MTENTAFNFIMSNILNLCIYFSGRLIYLKLFPLLKCILYYDYTHILRRVYIRIKFGDFF